MGCVQGSLRRVSQGKREVVDPNSKNQIWSVWEYRIYPDGTKRPDFQTVKENFARFGRLVFGSVSEMKIVCGTDEYSHLYWEVTIRTEGHPVHDPAYADWTHDKWLKFFAEGFGQHSQIRYSAKLEAGDRQDGKPADQLLIMPNLVAKTKLFGG